MSLNDSRRRQDIATAISLPAGPFERRLISLACACPVWTVPEKAAGVSPLGANQITRPEDKPFLTRADEEVTGRWTMIVQSLTRPYPVSLPMVVLVALVPLYVFIAGAMPGRTVHVPAVAWDRFIPLQPTWALVYGMFYLFLIVLPVFVVRQEEHIRRTVLAYLTVWIAAYICFLVYPTIAPRPNTVDGQGFAMWGLRFLYSADPPYNCFPSLHVAHSFVSALTCQRVHRKVGIAAAFCAALVALSTLYSKQHYILDVIAGAFLAGVAYAVFLRGFAHERVPLLERRLAPVFALGTFAIAGLGLVGFWVAYRLSG